MDQLTMDSIAAQKAGMSYGKWKALHYVPAVVVPKQPKELVYPGCEVKQKKYCAICGKELPLGKSRYCSRECDYENQKVKQREWYHRNKLKISKARKERLYGKI